MRIYLDGFSINFSYGEMELDTGVYGMIWASSKGNYEFFVRNDSYWKSFEDQLSVFFEEKGVSEIPAGTELYECMMLAYNSCDL